MSTIMTLPKIEYPSMDDARLAQYARTDPQAFAELYRRHIRSIYRYHLAHTGNIKDAEDLTSQTFMAALEGIRSFRGTGPYITWLIGIASRKRALFFRGKKPQVPLDTVLHLPTLGLPTDKAAARRGASNWINLLERCEPSAKIARKQSSYVFLASLAPQKRDLYSVKAKRLFGCLFRAACTIFEPERH